MQWWCFFNGHLETIKLGNWVAGLEVLNWLQEDVEEMLNLLSVLSAAHWPGCCDACGLHVLLQAKAAAGADELVVMPLCLLWFYRELPFKNIHSIRKISADRPYVINMID